MVDHNIMSEFFQINLSDMIVELGENRTKAILSNFTCPLNEDVEDFLKQKAIVFSARGFAKTYLVYWREGEEKELIGYYTIAQKHFEVFKDAVSNSCARRLNQYGSYKQDTRTYVMPAPLIGQLGKNFTEGNDCLISGDELLKMALDRIRDIQHELGGRYTYIECEDKPKLIKFYEDNGFKVFGKRPLDKDETGLDGQYLIQLMKYMDADPGK